MAFVQEINLMIYKTLPSLVVDLYDHHVRFVQTSFDIAWHDIQNALDAILRIIGF
jgi:hypothetical protein